MNRAKFVYNTGRIHREEYLDIYERIEIYLDCSGSGVFQNRYNFPRGPDTHRTARYLQLFSPVSDAGNILFHILQFSLLPLLIIFVKFNPSQH